MSGFEKEQQQIVRQKSDAFMKQIACLLAEENLQEYKAEKSITDSELPTALKAALEESVRLQEEKEKREAQARKRKQKAKGLVRAAAILLAFCLLGGVVLTVTVDAFRIKLMDILFKDHGEYVEMNLVDQGSLPADIRAQIPEDWENLFYPGWLPEGYELTAISGIQGGMKDLLFEGPNSGYISFDFIPTEESSKLIDSEETEFTDIKIGRYPAVCLKREKRIILVWEQSGFTFSLITEISEEEAIKIAENISYVVIK